MKRILLYLAIGWAAIFMTIVCFVDFDAQMQPLIQISDYLMTFHVAGYLVAHGQTAVLYPPADSLTFAGMPFDRAAHLLLAKMPASSVAEFMYMPVAAAVFIPFSYAPLHWSLFLWQLLSFGALFFGLQLVWMACTAGGGSNSVGADGAANNIVLRSLSGLWLLPVCLTIWIGQVGLLFGLVPLAAGYFLVCRNSLFLGGLVWALAVLKPQFLVPAAVLSFAFIVRRRFRASLGLAVGLAILAIISVIFYSPQLNIDWLHCLKISDIVYSNPKSGIATHIATSLPRTLILMLPAATQLVAKPAIYGLAALLFASALYLVWLCRKSDALDDASALRLSFLTGIFVTPLVMPHFFLYDYCLFALAVPITFFSQWPEKLNWPVKKLILITFAVVNVYSMIVLAAHQFAVPLLFMLCMLGLYFYLGMLVLQNSKSS